METDRLRCAPVLLAAALLLWPAVWNGYPIVFADTGTYLSQAIHRYLGWDRPPFYSIFLLALHWTVTLWPVVAAQALIAAWVLSLVLRLAGLHRWWLPGVALFLSVFTWLPWMVCQIMPDLFTALLAPVLFLLAGGVKWFLLLPLAAFMISSQQSSLPLSLATIVALILASRRAPILPTDSAPPRAERKATVLPLRAKGVLFAAPLLAMAAMAAINLAGHGRLSLSPYGNVFLLARVIYDGPGMTALRRDCPEAGWRLCPFLDRFPPTSDEFLWRADSPILLAGGHKAVSAEAGAIIAAGLRAEPWRALRAALGNTWEQLLRFESGDGLEAWPHEVSPGIARDFPAWENATYRAARQQQGALPAPWPWLHRIVALLGVAGCIVLLPLAFRRRHPLTGLLLVALLALPVGAAITGGLSTPHDRYQSRLMWLPPFVALIAAASMARRREAPHMNLNREAPHMKRRA